MKNRHLLPSIALFVAGVAARLLYAQIAPDAVFGDQDEYVSGAERLLRGEPLAEKNWQLFVRAPGYSLFIALVWKIAGNHSLLAIKVAQSLLSAAIVFYAFALTRRLKGPIWAALLAGAVAAFYPYFIQFSGVLGTEAVFAFFVAAGTYHLWVGLSEERPRFRHLLLAAVLLGLGNLVRPNLSTFLPPFVLWLVWVWRKRPLALAKIAAVLLLPTLLISVPWTVSVYRRGLGLMWVTDGAGVWYFNGHNDQALALLCKDLSDEERTELNKFPGLTKFTQTSEFRRAAAAPPTKQQAAFWDMAFEWDRRNLSSLPCLMAKKFVGYWRPWVNPIAYPPKMVLLSSVALPLLVLGLLGWWMQWRRGERTFTVIVAIQVVTGTVVAVLFSTANRYRIPIVDVLLIPYAALAAAHLLQRIKRFGSKPEPAPVAFNV